MPKERRRRLREVSDKVDEEREGVKPGATGTRRREEAGGGVGGWAPCREEVICQIGFHSVLVLRAACQAGRLTVSDSPLCISTYIRTHTLMHSVSLTRSNVSGSLLSEWSAALFIEPAIPNCVL